MLQSIKAALRRRRVNQTYRELRTLNQVELLALMMNSDTGLGLEDCDNLVRLAFDGVGNGEKETVYRRIAEHLVP